MFLIKKNWFNLLENEFNSQEYINFSKWLENEYHTTTIFPKAENVFNALNLVKFDDVKVVIVGQDPYFNINQAHGLSFSVEKNIAVPKSLQNIYRELHDDLGCYIPNHGNLTKWATQGVLLLNSVLTVECGKPNSHTGKGWEKITTKIISLLNEREKPVIFMLWGANAKAFTKYITNNQHYILTSAHPSPMSANQGGWFGCKHFSKTNNILTSLNNNPIDWQIENI